MISHIWWFWNIKTFKMARASSIDSDQHAHLHNLISVRCLLGFCCLLVAVKTDQTKLMCSLLGIHNMSRLTRKPTKWPAHPAKYSDQPEHPPSLIRVFAVRMKKHWVLSWSESSLCSQVILLVLPWGGSYHFVGLALSWLRVLPNAWLQQVSANKWAATWQNQQNDCAFSES